MKTNLLYSIVLLLLVSITNYAQNNCSKYYPLKEGVRSVVTTYDDKDRVSGSVKYEIKDVTDQGATMVNEIFDDKGKSLLNSEVTLQCNDDGISIDFKSLISSQIIDQYKASGMEVNMTGTNISIPNNLTVGQTLPDAEIVLNMSMASVSMSMTAKTTDRKVIAKENITTEAGTFNCVVISAQTTVEMGIKKSMNSKQWLSEGVGVVKTEDYDSSGKLISKSILTEFED